MRSGNIYKLFYGNVVIITGVTDDYVHWISADYANSSGGTYKLTRELEVTCDCMLDCCEPSIDCPDCHGTGRKMETRHGMDKATYLADNMFDYIKSRMMKNFDF